jgi:DNA-binding MarR family transcriptional regulator
LSQQIVVCDSLADAEPVRGTQKGKIMAVNPTADQMVGILRETIVALVRRDGPDLSARQLGVFLTCYLRDGGHTVRGLAAELNVSKPAITRALDRLGELDLARRKVDPLDRRSILVQRTLKGAAFLRDLRSIMGEAATSSKKASHTSEAPSRRTANA